MKNQETNISFTSSPGKVIGITVVAKATAAKASLSGTQEQARMSLGVGVPRRGDGNDRAQWGGLFAVW